MGNRRHFSRLRQCWRRSEDLTRHNSPSPPRPVMGVMLSPLFSDREGAKAPGEAAFQGCGLGRGRAGILSQVVRLQRPLPNLLTTPPSFSLCQRPMSADRGLAASALGACPGLAPLCCAGSRAPEPLTRPPSCLPPRHQPFPAGWVKGQPRL